MKKIGIVLFTILFIFLAPFNTAHAANDACPSPYTDKMKDKIEEFQDKDATIIQAYIMEFSEGVINMFDLNTLSQLIYGNPYCIWFSGGDAAEAGLEYGLFPASLKANVVDPFFKLFSSVFVVALTLAIMILGLRMSYSVLGTNKVRAHNELLMYFAAGTLMTCYVFGVELLFGMNEAITGSVKDMLTAQGVSTSFGYISTDFLENAKTLEFSDILFFYAEWIILFFLNLMYLLRLFVITVMMMLGGAAIISLLFEKGRPFFKFWFVGFISTIFLQSIHAIYFGIVLLFISLGSLGFIFKFILLLLFLPMTTMLMSWLGMADGLLSGKVAQDTVNKTATAVKVGQMGKRALTSKKGNQTPADTVGNTKISSLAQGGGNWNKFKKVATVSNTVLASAAGMTIGAGGSVLAGTVASKATNMAIQAPRNLVTGGKGLHNAITNLKDGKLDMNNLQDKRDHFGNVGESIGVMFGKGDLGRGIGYATSGVSRQRLLNEQKFSGISNPTVEGIVAQYPGANIQFQQTNEGSGFYMQMDGEMKMISPRGAADPTLKDGETRKIDYQARTLSEVAEQKSTFNSTQSLLSQTSTPYIMDAQNQRFNDSNFNANKINMNDYYQANHANGKNTIPSDVWADRVNAWGAHSKRGER